MLFRSAKPTRRGALRRDEWLSLFIVSVVCNVTLSNRKRVPAVSEADWKGGAVPALSRGRPGRTSGRPARSPSSSKTSRPDDQVDDLCVHCLIEHWFLCGFLI